mgnify:CR=1 FL=1
MEEREPTPLEQAMSLRTKRLKLLGIDPYVFWREEDPYEYEREMGLWEAGSDVTDAITESEDDFDPTDYDGTGQTGNQPSDKHPDKSKVPARTSEDVKFEVETLGAQCAYVDTQIDTDSDGVIVLD